MLNKKIDIPIDAETRRLALDDVQVCSFCQERALTVAREYDAKGENINNTYFCLNHWGEYWQQEYREYVARDYGRRMRDGAR